MKKIKKLLLFLLLISLGFVAIIGFTNYWIISQSAAYLYKDPEKTPVNQVGLILGTARYIAKGRENPYFRYRIDAAVKLYKAGKIKHIIVSGDNRTKFYDEATEMQKALMAEGIPESAITRDYAGLRTLDSVVRCKEVFGIHEVTIISQKFHVERAVYIALHRGIKPVGFCADDVDPEFGKRTRIREVFAKFKAILDIHVLHKQPQHLGEPIQINL